MPATPLTLILDPETARRFDAFATRTGLDRTAALDLAVRAFLDAEDKAHLTQKAVLAAAAEGEAETAHGFTSLHEEIRRWLLSWGSEAETKRPRSC